MLQYSRTFYFTCPICIFSFGVSFSNRTHNNASFVRNYRKEVMLTYSRNIKRFIFIISTFNNASPEIMERKNSMYRDPMYATKRSISICCCQKSCSVFAARSPAKILNASIFIITLNKASPDLIKRKKRSHVNVQPKY